MPKNTEEYSYREEKQSSCHSIVSHKGTPQENRQAIHALTGDSGNSQPLFEYANNLRNHLDTMLEQHLPDHERELLVRETRGNVQHVWNNLYWIDRTALSGTDWLSQADLRSAGDPGDYPEVMPKEDLHHTTVQLLRRVDTIMDSL